MTYTSPVLVSSEGHVSTLIMCSLPHNYIDLNLITALADALEELDSDDCCRALVLGSSGKSFCAGADFSVTSGFDPLNDTSKLYEQGMRLLQTRKPIVAAVNGPAIGAGAGLALLADFRIVGPASRFSVPFNRLGLHPGFGMTHTLPRLVGLQVAARLFYTCERLNGEQMLKLGLADEIVPDGEVVLRAQALALEIAKSAPLAVQSTRVTLRLGLVDEIRTANAREWQIQQSQFSSQDFLEGITAASEHRPPVFKGR